jgi:acyl-CoA thioesterase FadM
MARIKIDLPEAFAFSTTLPVRVTDLNYGNHLGNDSVLSILHEARVRYLRHLGCSELDAFGAGLIMADAVILYKGEGFYGDLLKVEVAAGDISSRGFVLFYRLTCDRDGKKVAIAEAETGMLGFNYQTRKVVSLPRELKEKLCQNLFCK